MEKNLIIEVINKLPHSKSRVPYTYHHDYLRMKSPHFSGMSRSEVASFHKENDDELHAVALIQVLTELSALQILDIGLTSTDIEIINEAKQITSDILARY